MGISKETMIKLYRIMITIRKFEERAMKLHEQGKIPGNIHLYIGEEAVAAGVVTALNIDDKISSTHRGHGHMIAKGGNVKAMMAELYGKETGCCKGKGGSMHIADFSIGSLGACGIVAGGIPIATGSALASKLDKDGKVTVCFFGEGAFNQGSFHECLNMASLWKLPVLFVIENNMYAITSSIKETVAGKLKNKGKPYDIPTKSIDGNNVAEVYENSIDMIKHARMGSGPSLLICNTYRLVGHFAGEQVLPWRYRTKDEISQWRAKCPIKRFRKYLIQKNLSDSDILDTIDLKVKKMIDEAVEFAEASNYPCEESVLTNVFANGILEE